MGAFPAVRIQAQDMIAPQPFAVYSKYEHELVASTMNRCRSMIQNTAVVAIVLCYFCRPCGAES
jgi:hypothetical protein